MRVALFGGVGSQKFYAYVLASSSLAHQISILTLIFLYAVYCFLKLYSPSQA